MTNLLQMIENKREEMKEIAEREGLTSDKVIRCSQELDKLLNDYQISMAVTKD
ncbi:MULTISPECIES: aspartyl-phosphate phosphatase Spo0E family protein [Bacillaceae]|uniref:aspartyl-phosphate phosphatase Spo0E family protein n=1 Tax=Bacillaceae TaxID=186817 RepID=UPI00203283C8|nr:MULTISPECIES: aspartyl-phosphate phosphatase Spo0E family protein [Bacillaceae]MDX8360360.1 aspartyl-phosphate phosphatase Spo0E family protein [Cytobacillus sp. IB215316]